MVTTVGTEDSFEKLVQNLLILEHDAIAAYESTLSRLDSEVAKTKIAESSAIMTSMSPSSRGWPRAMAWPRRRKAT